MNCRRAWRSTNDKLDDFLAEKVWGNKLVRKLDEMTPTLFPLSVDVPATEGQGGRRKMRL